MNLKQSIPISSVRNARELGGYITSDGKRIKSGLLLRTAKLDLISDKDIKILIDKYNVGDIIDFRFDLEINNQEDKPLDGAVYHNFDVMDLSGFGYDNMPEEESPDLQTVVSMMDSIGMTDGTLYISFLENEKGKRGFRNFFRVLINASPEKAVLWHCTSGKDRTGLAAMLIMSALGVDEDTIINDYLLTNLYHENYIEDLKQSLKAQGLYDDFIYRASLMFYAVNESFMRNAIAFLKKKYGSVMGYILEALNIKEEEIELLKDKYLIKAVQFLPPAH